MARGDTAEICRGYGTTDRASIGAMEGVARGPQAQKPNGNLQDSLIAATALFHGHTVATHNKRHFEPTGVPIVDPLA